MKSEANSLRIGWTGREKYYGFDREILYRSALLIIMADEEFGEAERSWLDDLAHRLNLDTNRRAAIEEELRGAEIQA